MIDTPQLRYLVAVAAEGSLSAAARKLGVRQPTLTNAVQKLEERLDTRLLHRDAKGARLTETGKALVQTAEHVLGQLDDVVEVIHGLESEERGRFVIGCYESLAAYFLPGLLPTLLHDAPGLDVTIHNVGSRATRDAVVAGDVHFGLVVNPVEHPDLVMVELFSDEVGVRVLADAQASTVAEAHQRIIDGPVVHSPRVDQSTQILDELARAGVHPARAMTCGDLELVKSLTLAGIGPGVLPARVARYHHEGELRLLHPDLPRVPDTISLIWHADLHRTRAALRLKDALIEHGRRLAEDDLT